MHCISRIQKIQFVLVVTFSVALYARLPPARELARAALCEAGFLLIDFWTVPIVSVVGKIVDPAPGACIATATLASAPLTPLTLAVDMLASIPIEAISARALACHSFAIAINRSYCIAIARLT